MYIRVNKNTGTRKPTVKYAALSAGTDSHVWYDEDSASASTPKRRNRIILTRESTEARKNDKFDA